MTSKVELNNSIDLQSTNWKGSIPIMLSLAPSSLSSPTMPPPVHHMISRQTYLHIALENEVRRFHEYAPIVVNFQSIQQSSVDDDEDDDDHDGNGDDNENRGDGAEKEKKEDGNANNDKKKDEKKNKKDKNSSNDNNIDNTNDPYPICWFEDEETGTPLRWHFFAGILFDLLKLKRRRNSSSNSNFLPWKIRVHYTSYPDSILPFHNEDVTHVIFQHYLNSLKQALYIQHNSNRIVKNMTKQSHLQIWDGIKRSQFEVYREIAIGLNGGGSSNSNSNSSSNSNNDNSTNTNAGDGSSTSNDITLENVPIRVLVDHRPAFARPCNCYHEDKSMMTVGDILHEWLPHLFTSNADADTNNNNGNDDDDNNIDSPKCYWSVQGIQVPLATSISDLWKSLCHPDRFLYIIIVTNI